MSEFEERAISSGLSHVTPPSRDGKIRNVDTDGSKKKHLQTFMIVIATAFVAVLLMNYRVVAGSAYLAVATIDLINRNLDAAAIHYKDAYFINPDDVNS